MPVFCRVGIGFEISHHATRWLRNQVGSLLEMDKAFSTKTAGDLEIVVYLDGQEALPEPRVLGPTLKKREGEIEIRIIVPLSQPYVASHDEICAIVRMILICLFRRLPECHVNTSELELGVDSICQRFQAREWLPGSDGPRA